MPHLADHIRSYGHKSSLWCQHIWHWEKGPDSVLRAKSSHGTQGKIICVQQVVDQDRRSSSPAYTINIIDCLFYSASRCWAKFSPTPWSFKDKVKFWLPQQHAETFATALWQGTFSIYTQQRLLTCGVGTEREAEPKVQAIHRGLLLWEFFRFDSLHFEISSLEMYCDPIHANFALSSSSNIPIASLALSFIEEKSSGVVVTVSSIKWVQYPECLYRCECWLWYELRLGVRMLGSNNFWRWRCEFCGGSCW